MIKAEVEVFFPAVWSSAQAAQWLDDWRYSQMGTGLLMLLAEQVWPIAFNVKLLLVWTR